MHRRTFLQTSGIIIGSSVLSACAELSTDQAQEYQPLGELQLPGTTDVVVSDDSQTAFAAVTDGFATVDISDPEDLSILTEKRDIPEDQDRPLRDIRDVKVAGDRLIVAGPAEGRFHPLEGFLVYDVADPAEPDQLAFFETSYPIHNCDIDGTTVYLAPGYPGLPLVIVDISDDKPHQIARWDLLDHEPGYQETPGWLRPLHDVLIKDGYAYASWWDAGTWMLNVSDPSAPEYVSHVSDLTLEELQTFEEYSRETDLAFEEPPGNDHSVAVNDDDTLLAIGKESWDSPFDDDNEGPSGIDLWDITEQSNPEKEATISPVQPADATRSGTVTTAHNFDIHEDRLYSSWYQDGVKIHDVSEPAAPDLLAHWRTPSNRSFFTAQLAQPGEFFVASNRGISDIESASVLTFPDEVGDQADMPPLDSTPTESVTD